MGTIRASCGDCGDVELPTRDVRIRVCNYEGRGTYSFKCPRCQMMVVKPAERRTIDLLVAFGVQLATWDLPAELYEPRSGPPLTLGNLIDFNALLCDDAAFDAAVARLRCA